MHNIVLCQDLTVITFCIRAARTLINMFFFLIQFSPKHKFIDFKSNGTS